MMDDTKIREWNEQFRNRDSKEIIAYFLNHFKDKIAFSTSLGPEDQVITHMISQIDPKANIFTLDTGRVFPETYDLMDRTNKKLKVNIRVYFPDAAEVEEMVEKKGINLFYDSIENRKECCNIRKIKPLMRATKGLDAWITGLRREQSITRKDLQWVEQDDNNNLLKINPLAHWTEQDVWDYIAEHKVPVNALHKKGFASIGCQPCTRAIAAGEDVRAGRWWWENPETKECGLHKR
ncbi:MAG: phosphoadenylyl-sulfate reductase [Bacteroidales bacterium]|nr:phosphoadenylyl-sulfate reductase [Bacteroidales bacterium]